MTGGYRIWPALTIAVVGLAGAAVAVTAAASGSDSGCPSGQDWVAVTPYEPTGEPGGTVLADYGQRMQPLLRACLDIADLPALDPAGVPDPRS